MADNVETYTLQLAASGADQAVSSIDKVNEALAALQPTTRAETVAAEQLTEALDNITRRQALRQLSEDAAAGKVSVEQLVDQIVQLDLTDSEVQKLTNDFARLSEEIASVPAPKLSAAASGAGEDSSGSGISLGGARSTLRAGGFLLGADAGGGSLRAIGQIATLTAVLGPVGIAAGLFAVVLRGVTENEQQAAEAAQKYIDALAGTSGDTTEDLQKKIDQEKANQATIQGGIESLQGFQKELDNLQQSAGSAASVAAAAAVDTAAAAAAEKARAGAVDGYAADAAAADASAAVYAQAQQQRAEDAAAALTDLNAKVYDATEGAVGFKDGVGTWITSSDQLNGVLKDGQDKLKVSSDALAFLGVQIDSAATKANTAAAALQALTDEQVKSAQQDVAINNMTKEQRDAKAKQDMADFDAISKLLLAGNLTEDAVVRLEDQQTALLEDYNRLTAATNTYADQVKALADATQLISDQTDHYMEALATEGDIEADIAKQTQALADAEAEANEKSIALEQDYEKKHAGIESDGAAKVQQINEDNADKLAKIAQDNADRVAKIERDFARSYQDAIGNRDAYAAQKAEQKREDDLSDQALANQRAIESQQKAYDKQIEAQEAQQAKQLRSLEDSYWKQQEAIDDAFNKQKKAIDRKLAQDQVDLQNAINAEIAIADNGAGSLRDIHEGMWIGLYDLSDDWATKLVENIGATLAIAAIGAEIGKAVNSLPPFQETPGGSGTPFPQQVGLGTFGGSRQIVIQVSPTDGSEATNNFLRALDKMLPDNFRER